MKRHEWITICDETNNPPQMVEENNLALDVVITAPAPEVARYESVWDAICDSPEESLAMRIRSYLLRALGREIKRLGQNPETICQQLNISNNRLDDILQGRIDRLSRDQLTGMCKRIGLSVDRLMMEVMEK